MHHVTVVTSAGLLTNSLWWRTIAVDGSSLVFESAEEPKVMLIVASFPTEREAQSLMNELMDRMRFGAKRFDVREWPGPDLAKCPEGGRA